MNGCTSHICKILKQRNYDKLIDLCMIYISERILQWDFNISQGDLRDILVTYIKYNKSR